MIITVLITRSLFCSYRGVARLLNSWRNHLQTGLGAEVAGCGATMPPPPSLPRGGDSLRIPLGCQRSRGAPCPQWRSEPSAGHHGGPSPLKPHTPILPPSDWPMQNKTLPSHQFCCLGNSQVLHIPQASSSQKPFHISLPNWHPPNSTLPPETPPLGPHHFGGREEPFQKMFRCSPF